MAKMSVEQFREFSSAVIRHLPQVDPSDAQLLIDEQHRLASILRGAFRPALVYQFRVLLTPKLTVDAVCKDQMIDLGGVFDCLPEMWSEPGNCYHSRLITDHWPTEDKEIDFRIVSPGREMTGFEMVEEMNKMGLRPANVTETIFFACQYHFLLDETRDDFPRVVILADVPERMPGETPTSEVIQDGQRGSWWMGTMFWADTKYPAVAK